MKKGISVRIDVTKIDKSRLFQGKKGTYLDLTTFVDLDEKDQYDNNGFVTQSATEDERKAGVQLPILGNVKVFWEGEGQSNQAAAPEPTAPGNFEEDSIPF